MSISRKSIFILIQFLVFLSIIPVGSLSRTTEIESCAQFAALMAKNKSRKDKVFSVFLEYEGSQHEISTQKEFYDTYGVFGEQNTYFLATKNIDKRHESIVEEIDNLSKLSYLCADTLNSVKINNHFKHSYYPLELMFETIKGDVNKNYCFTH